MSSNGPAVTAKAGVGEPAEPESKSRVGAGESPRVAPEAAKRNQRDVQRGSKASLAPDAFVERTHSYLWANVVLADQKAGFLFAGLAATLAYIHEKGISQRWLVNPKTWGPGSWLEFLAVAGLIVGAALALLVVLPRFSGARRGVVYWKAITGFKSAGTYVGHVRERSPSDLHEEMLRHCFELAQVAEKKFRLFNLALWSGAVGLVATLLSLAVFNSSP